MVPLCLDGIKKGLYYIEEERYNVEKSTIGNIYRGKNWKNITKEYDFSCRITIRNSKGQFQVVNTKNLNKENWNFGSSGLK